MAAKLQSWGCPVKKSDQCAYDRWAWSNYKEAIRAPSRVELWWRVHDALTPGFLERHAWTEMVIEAGCNHRWNAIMGCSGAAKTRNWVGFSGIAWMCDPANTSVILCSTTMKSLRKRAWAEVVAFNKAVNMTLRQDYDDDVYEYGAFIDSQTVWRYVDPETSRADDRNAIFGLAVQEGSITKVAGNIQGIHTKNQIILIDEAEEINAPIWIAMDNLYEHPINAGGYFVMGAAFNPRSRLSRAGQMAEPELGWNTVTIDTERWVGKAHHLDGEKVNVIRFDICKSPNVLAPPGKQVSKYLPSRAVVTRTMQEVKSQGKENDPSYWTFKRAFPPPDGLLKTLFTESELLLHRAYDQHTFTGREFAIIGTCDPAYTGDRPICRFAALGEIAPGKLGLEHMEPIELVIDSKSARPPKYQLVDQVRAHCQHVLWRGQRYNCPPENFGFDCTGDSGVFEIAQQEWSPRVIGIMFSGSPSENMVELAAGEWRPASEVYGNKRAEMFHTTNKGHQSGQIKGLDRDTAAELCAIKEENETTEGTMKPKKVIEPKPKYKLRCHKSPDLADAYVELTEVARIKGFTVAAVGLLAQATSQHDKRLDAINAAREEPDFADENAMQWHEGYESHWEDPVAELV